MPKKILGDFLIIIIIYFCYYYYYYADRGGCYFPSGNRKLDFFVVYVLETLSNP